MPISTKLKAGLVLCAAMTVAGWTSVASAEQGTAANPGQGPGMQRGAPYPNRPAAPPRRDMAQELQLNEEQRKQVQALMDKQRELGRQHMEQMRAEQEKIGKLYQAEEWDADAITAAQNAMHEQRMAMMREMINSRNEIYRLLDEQQRERFSRMMQPPPMMGGAPQ